ncbi:MAG: gliding motility-associated C-terminal domain-containing protein, partial [Flavobacteriales bacterium]
YNEYGCSDSTFIYIDMDYPVSVYIPNAFTPDGDGINDIFRITASGNLSPFKLEIFNRWGELVYESLDQDQGWLGNHQNGDYYVPDGIYTYRVSYGTKGKVLDVLHGNVTVMR